MAVVIVVVENHKWPTDGLLGMAMGRRLMGERRDGEGGVAVIEQPSQARLDLGRRQDRHLPFCRRSV